jgi:hypothetical protein
MVAAKIADMKVGGNGNNQHCGKSANLQNSTSQSDATEKLNASMLLSQWVKISTLPAS